MDVLVTDLDGILSSPHEQSCTPHQPAGSDQQRRRSTASTPSSPATSHERRLSRTRTIRSAHHHPRKRRHNVQRVPSKAKRLRLDRAGRKLHKHLHQQPPVENTSPSLPSYEELFFPEAVPIPQKPSLSDLPPGLLYRRALKYTHGIDAGAPVAAHPVITAAMASSLVSSIGRLGASRTNVSSAHSKSTVSVEARPVKEGKSLMSGNGISCSFELAEPVVYLSGFKRDGYDAIEHNPATILRGKFVLDIQKSVKLKSITVRFYGKARTEWPEGIPPDKTAFYEEEKLRYQVIPFYNAMYPTADVGYGAQCTYKLKNQEASSSTTSLQNIEFGRGSKRRSDTLSSRDQRRLSMQNVPARSFNKSESPATTTQQKGYKTFYPGVYEYSFEIPMDHTLPESMNLPMGSVKWILDAIVERAGTFKPNLHGVQEITVVRAPGQNSMESIEPIAISRKWEDQLHYDIVISGKAFPIGGKIPIAFKLTPLAKVQCHRIKVYATENVDYYCRGKKVTRKDGQKRILLMERNAGKPLAPEYAGSSFNILAGGELPQSDRDRHRHMAQNFRSRMARAVDPNAPPAPLPPPSDNLLGDIDLGLEHLITQTEIEMEVQLPTCAKMMKDKSKAIHPDTMFQNIVVHHWIKIVMRLSRADTDDPTGRKRRHFEISIDSPFHILSCLATQNHTSLPEYQSSPTPRGTVYECGCPNAASISPASSTGSIPGSLPTFANDPALGLDGAALPQLAVPPRAHVASTTQQPEGAGQRPIHLLRVPSYNPPAFTADEPPPPLETPPPMYDHVIGTPSVDGLADYFARLSEYDDPRDEHDDDEDHSSDEDDHLDRSVTRHGTVNVPNPRTPGGRATSRSMDVRRDFMFQPEAFNPRLQRARRDQLEATADGPNRSDPGRPDSQPLRPPTQDEDTTTLSHRTITQHGNNQATTN